MSMQLITGPVGSGKTSAAVDAVCALQPHEWVEGVRYVVPTTELARQIEGRLMERAGISGILGNVVCTFYSLAQEIASRSGYSGRPISDISKAILIRQLVADTDLSYLHQSAESPGFINALGAVLGELKLSRVRPDDLDEAFRTCTANLSDTSRQKISELVRLYRGYQNDALIRNDLHDREGIMWLALEGAVQHLSGLKLLVFDGFDSLNGVQSEMLRLAAEAVSSLIFTLCYEDDRPEVFEPLTPTRNLLLGLGAQETVFERPSAIGSAIQHLESSLFRDSRATAEPDESISILEGGTPSIQLEMVAEEILRLVQEYDWSFSDIAVTGRNMDACLPRIERMFRLWDIPTNEPDRPLASSSVARLLSTCISIVTDGWRRIDTVRALKSEHFTPDLEQACHVEAEVYRRGVLSGRDNWLSGWQGSPFARRFFDQTLKPVTEFDDRIKAVRGFDECLEAVRMLLYSFALHADDPEFLARDTAARRAIADTLDELGETYALIGRDIGCMEVLTDLVTAISLKEYSVPKVDADAVRIIPASGVGTQRFRAVFIIDLLEQVFPRQIREEPFLRDSERTALNKSLDGRLQEWGYLQDSERRVFHSVVSAAVDRLYLCYPLADQSGKESLPSFYVREARELLGDRITPSRRDVSRPTTDIRAVRNMVSLRRSVTYSIAQSSMDGDDRRLAACVFDNLPGDEVRTLDQVFSEADPCSPTLSSELVTSHLRGTDADFSCTQLESYAACPFMHFCSAILGLEPVRQDTRALDLGSLLHAVLQRLFSQLSIKSGGRLDIGSLDRQAALRQAYDILDDEFSNRTRLSHLPQHVARTQTNALRRYLDRYIAGEIGSAAGSAFYPTFFELEFGSHLRPDRQRDPASRQEPLAIEEDGFRIHVSGKMDRVDLDSEGRAMVIDYKLGTPPPASNFDKGLSFQTMVYANALYHVFGIEPVGTEYRCLKRWEPVGFYSDTGAANRTKGVCSAEDFTARMEQCRTMLLDIASQMRNGCIDIKPKDCKDYCSYRGICRIEDYDLYLLKMAQASGEEVAE